MKKTNRKAFTLVELVIVIAVIAILAAVMIPVFGGIIDSANKASDVSTAANLTVALSQQLGGVKTEAELYQVIADTFGEDFANTMTPKSAKQGNHYWYDAANNRVILDTYENLGQYVTKSTANVDSGASTVGKVEGVVKSSFAPDSLRTIPKTNSDGVTGYFYLLDKDGSDFVKDLIALDTCTAQTFNTIVQKFENGSYSKDSENGIAEKVLDNLANVVIANNNGMFAYDESTKATTLYVPEGTEGISDNAVVYGSASTEIDLSGINSVVLPSTIEDIQSYSLNGFPEGTTITVNTTEDKLDDIFAAEATDCVIQISNGDSYKIVGKDIVKLDSNGNLTSTKIATTYTIPVASVLFTIEDNVIDSATKAAWDATDVKKLYIAFDFAGNLKLNAVFLDASGNEIKVGATTWTVGEGTNVPTISGDGFNSTLTVPKDVADTTVTATFQGEDFDISIVNVGVKSVTITDIGGGGKDYDGEGTSFSYVYELPYTTTNNTKTVTATVTGENNYVHLDQVLDPFEETYVSFNGTTLTITPTNNNYQEKVKFSRGGVESSECILNLVDNTNSPFVKSDILTANEAKIGEGNVYIGTKNGTQNITLSQLFKLNDGVDITNQTVTYSFSINNWTSQHYKAADWSTTPMTFGTFTDEQTVTITITVGGASQSATVILVNGAQNVVDEASWKSAGGSLVLLNDITLSDYTSSNKNNKSSVTYINGNFHAIKCTTYTVEDSNNGNCYFLNLANGASINNLVINGPTYDTQVGSGDCSKGKFTHGIVLGSGSATINKSYIYGFRAPIRLNNNGGTLTIKDSVIEGGAYANIYVYQSGTIDLKNSILLQETNGYSATVGTVGTKIVGCGIMIDTKETDGVTVKIDSTSKISVWLSSAGGYANGTSAKDYIDQASKYFGAYVHSVSSVNYLNAAIGQESKTTLKNWKYTHESQLMTVSNSSNQYTAGTFVAVYSDIDIFQTTPLKYLAMTSNAHSSSGCTCTQTTKPWSYTNSPSQWLTSLGISTN